MNNHLRKITIERLANGRWKLVRERDENGETLTGLTDISDCFDAVLSAYHADGSPRSAGSTAPKLAKKRSKRG